MRIHSIALAVLMVLASVASVAGADDRDVERREEERQAAKVRLQAAKVRREAAATAADAARAAADAARLRVFRGDRTRGVARTETTVVAPRHARLELESLGGAILVSGWDQNTMRVVAEHPADARVTVTVRPAAVVVKARGQLRVTVPGADGKERVRTVPVPVRVDYRLNVPRGTSLRLTGVDSEIRVEDVLGDVSAETVNGPVRVRGGRGAVRVAAINGGVEVLDVRGPVEASSVNEGLVLRDVQGSIRAETVGGTLELARVLSEAVEASTVSGTLIYEGSISPGGEYRFESHSGNVIVALPEHPDAAVTVETYGGSFQSSFPVPARRPRLGREFEFTLGDGRAELELASFSGVIRLVREGEQLKLALPARPAAPRPAPAPETPPAPRKK